MDAFFGKIDDATMATIKSFSTKYNLTLEDLHYKWEAYALSQPSEPEIASSLGDFQIYLAHEADRPKKKAKIGTPHTSRTRPVATPLRQIQSSATKPTTPLPAHIDRSGVLPSSSDFPSSPVAHYSSRQNAGKTISTLNENVEIDPSIPSAPAHFVPHVLAADYNYRPMYQQLSDASKVLDQQIERMIQVFTKEGGINEKDIVNPARTIQDEAIVIGRLGSDEPGYKQRLDPRGITIQTCRRLGAGTQTRLDLNQLSEYSFFPGQIVALKGTNPTGSSFVVSEVIAPPRMPFGMVSSDQQQALEGKRGESPIRLIVAAGPFTTQDNLDFQPLQDLVKAIKDTRPSSVILVGPFVEGDHPMLWASQKTDNFESLQDIFTQKVSPILSELDENIPVVLVPSTKDVITEDLQYPQPQFPRKKLGLPKNFKMVPNPAFFSLDEVVVTATSADSVQDILSSRTVQKNQQGSGFSQACGSIIEQRRVYPLFPGFQPGETPTEESIFEVSLRREQRAGVPLDVSHLDLADMDLAPNLLVVPSLTRPSAEIVNNVVCVNPGFLSKKSNGGTYAVVSGSAGPFWRNSRVDIILI